MTTRAAIQAVVDGPLVIDEVRLSEPGPDQVAVKLFPRGICHSQLHGMVNATKQRPMLLGHEGTGVVVQAGAEVSHVCEGDHVIVTWVTRAPRTAPPADMAPPWPSSIGVNQRSTPTCIRGVSTSSPRANTWSGSRGMRRPT